MNWLDRAFSLPMYLLKRPAITTEFVSPFRVNWGGFEKRPEREGGAKPAIVNPEPEFLTTTQAINVKIWELELAVDKAVRLHRPRAKIKAQLAEAIRLRDQLMARAANPAT